VAAELLEMVAVSSLEEEPLDDDLGTCEGQEEECEEGAALMGSAVGHALSPFLQSLLVQLQAS